MKCYAHLTSFIFLKPYDINDLNMNLCLLIFMTNKLFYFQTFLTSKVQSENSPGAIHSLFAHWQFLIISVSDAP